MRNKNMQFGPYLCPNRLWTRLWGRYHVPQNVFLVSYIGCRLLPASNLVYTTVYNSRRLRLVRTDLMGLGRRRSHHPQTFRSKHSVIIIRAERESWRENVNITIAERKRFSGTLQLHCKNPLCHRISSVVCKASVLWQNKLYIGSRGFGCKVAKSPNCLIVSLISLNTKFKWVPSIGGSTYIAVAYDFAKPLLLQLHTYTWRHVTSG